MKDNFSEDEEWLFMASQVQVGEYLNRARRMISQMQKSGNSGFKPSIRELNNFIAIVQSYCDNLELMKDRKALANLIKWAHDLHLEPSD